MSHMDLSSICATRQTQEQVFWCIIDGYRVGGGGVGGVDGNHKWADADWSSTALWLRMCLI